MSNTLKTFDDKAGMSKMNHALHEAIKTVGEEYGVLLTTGSLIYDPAAAECHVTVRGKLALGVAERDEKKEKDNFEYQVERYKDDDFARNYGLTKADWHLEVTLQGKKYRIVGIRQLAKAKPITLLDIKRNQRVVCNVDGLMQALHRPIPAPPAKRPYRAGYLREGYGDD